MKSAMENFVLHTAAHELPTSKCSARTWPSFQQAPLDSLPVLVAQGPEGIAGALGGSDGDCRWRRRLLPHPGLAGDDLRDDLGSEILACIAEEPGHGAELASPFWVSLLLGSHAERFG